MITQQEFANEFADLAHEAGITDTCKLEFPEYMELRNIEDPRSFAEVDPWDLHFAFAPQVLELPESHRQGLIMHEIGHVLCREMPGGGSETDADRAAESVYGIPIEYDHRFPGKGLQCVASSGMVCTRPVTGLLNHSGAPMERLQANPADFFKMRNKLRRKCEVCGKYVDKGEGYAVKVHNEWYTFHEDHLPEEFSAPPPPQEPGYIEVRLGTGNKVEIRLKGGRVGPEIFGAYKKACRPCNTRKIAGDWVNLIPLEDAGPVLDAMKEIEGVGVKADDSIIEAFQGRAEDVERRLAEAHARLEETERMLSARGQSLYDYQRSGIEWLATQDSAILADDMGLGKTVQALIAAPQGDPILVICPAIAKGVWMDEAAKWRPDLIPVVISGRGNFRWPIPGEMVIINYDILPGKMVKGGKYETVKLSVGAPEPDTVVIADEAHKIKNPGAQRSKKVKALMKMARDNGGKSWVLTATPIVGKPLELWSLLGAIDRAPFSGKKEFVRMMDGVQDRWGGYQWGTDIDPEVPKRLEPVMLRRVKDEVLTDLPAKRVQDIPVEGLTKSEMKQLDAIMDKWSAVLRKGDLPPFKEMSAARAMLAKSKIPSLLKIVEEYEEADEPLVVFSAYRAPIDMLGEREGWITITGSDDDKAKRRKAREFQDDPSIKGIALTIEAGGTAITLTRASNLIFNDLGWSPSDNAQARDRIHRIGQEYPVLIQRLVADHALDRRLAEILDTKATIIDRSVDAARKGTESVVDPEIAIELDRIAEGLEAETRGMVAELGKYVEEQETYRRKIAAWSADKKGREERRMEREWQDKIKQSARNRRVDIKVEDDDMRRPAETAAEFWALDGLIKLRAMDFDRAAKENFMGFSKADSSLGWVLADRAPMGLSDAEWVLALSILPKYHRQIGAPPADEGAIYEETVTVTTAEHVAAGAPDVPPSEYTLDDFPVGTLVIIAKTGSPVFAEPTHEVVGHTPKRVRIRDLDTGKVTTMAPKNLRHIDAPPEPEPPDDRETPEEIAKYQVSEAVDQQEEYPSLKAAFESYYDNVFDTAKELGWSDEDARRGLKIFEEIVKNQHGIDLFAPAFEEEEGGQMRMFNPSDRVSFGKTKGRKTTEEDHRYVDVMVDGKIIGMMEPEHDYVQVLGALQSRSRSAGTRWEFFGTYKDLEGGETEWESIMRGFPDIEDLGNNLRTAKKNLREMIEGHLDQGPAFEEEEGGQFRMFNAGSQENPARWSVVRMTDPPEYVSQHNYMSRAKDRAEKEAHRTGIPHGIRSFSGKHIVTVMPDGSTHTPNPPYSGFDPKYHSKPLPKNLEKLSYRRKRDALNVFMDWPNNREIIEAYGGETQAHSPESFDSVNDEFGIAEAHRKVNTIAKALWWVLPKSSDNKYYIEDIDLELLNRTSAVLYNEDGREFEHPPQVFEAEMAAQQAEYWEKYRDVFPEDEVPF